MGARHDSYNEERAARQVRALLSLYIFVNNLSRRFKVKKTAHVVPAGISLSDQIGWGGDM